MIVNFPRPYRRASLPKLRRLLAPSALLCLLAVPAATAAQNGEPAPGLAPEVATIIAHPTLDEATIGILAVDLNSGEVLIDYAADELLAPASVNKLFTVATALWRLGPAFVWQTPLAYTGELLGADDETISGDLWALGRGAPDIVEEQLGIAARAIRARGITRIDGDLVVDDRYFRFASHYRIEVTHHHRVRVRSGHGTDHVVGIVNIADPIPHGFIQRVF